MATALVMGDTPFVGLAVAEALATEGKFEEIILYGRDRVYSDKVTIIVGEIGSEFSIKTVFNKYSPSLIIFVPPYSRDRFGTYMPIEDTKYLLSAFSSISSLLATFKPPRFVFLSSAEIYGNCSHTSAKHPLRVSQNPKPYSRRGAALLAAESLFDIACKEDNIQYLTLRVGELFGKVDNWKVSRLNDMIHTLVSGYRVGLSAPSRRFDFNDLHTASEHIAKLAFSDKVGVFNVGSGNCWSLKEMAAEICDRLSLQFNKVVLTRSIHSYPSACLDVTSLSSLVDMPTSEFVLQRVSELTQFYKELGL